MLTRYRDGIVPAPGPSHVGERFAGLGERVAGQLRGLDFRGALEGTWELVSALNRAIDERKPWELHKEGRTGELDAVLYDLCEGLRRLAVMLHPFMPERMSALWEQLGSPGRIDADWSSSLQTWDGLPPLTQTAMAAPLFPKVELAPS